jgi:hypothetical protein
MSSTHRHLYVLDFFFAGYIESTCIHGIVRSFKFILKVGVEDSIVNALYG